MDFPGDISGSRIGDKVRTILPVEGFFKPAIDKEYQLGDSGRAKVVAIQTVTLSDIGINDLIAVNFGQIKIKRDGQWIDLDTMQCFERYWRSKNTGKNKWENNPSVLIVDMECIKSLHYWYNDQTGFYDYASYYGQLDAFRKADNS